MRWPMNPATGVAGFAVAAATELAGSTVPADHSIEVALITVIGGTFTIIVGQVLAEVFRSRRREVDHHAELGNEQAALVDHLLREIGEKDAEINRLKKRRRDT